MRVPLREVALPAPRDGRRGRSIVVRLALPRGSYAPAVLAESTHGGDGATGPGSGPEAGRDTGPDGGDGAADQP